MNKKGKLTVFLTLLALLVSGAAYAGNLSPTAGPSDPATAMYTLEDIYKRLLDRTAPFPPCFPPPSPPPTAPALSGPRDPPCRARIFLQECKNCIFAGILNSECKNCIFASRIIRVSKNCIFDKPHHPECKNCIFASHIIR